MDLLVEELFARLPHASERERIVLEEQIIEDHLYLARRIAQRYRDRGIELDDLLQVSRLALVTAVRRYQPSRGRFDPGLTFIDRWLDLPPAWRQLSPDQQRLLELRFFHELTQQQIAAHLGISQMQVSRNLTKLLEHLRGVLDGTSQLDPGLGRSA